MTLTTTLEIFDADANPEELYAALRDEAGIPSGHPIESWRSLNGESSIPA